ncbi:hypothetical protein PRZ61_06700 [Halomonas pacifica]|uniref:hypothetical protein n=1 Tax=Bisbaumannia pacifica TaxID=77098 RepID=UPI00235820D7|nr:hypothetical protein [Halomonas pacifica]MDC8803129.1 hypothetical protein [Halomonas pacifica]
MGIEDRDYFWEDRKRREDKFKRDTYYRPKEFRRRKGKKTPDDWNQPPANHQWKTLTSFMMGAIISLFLTMTSLIINPQWLKAPYQITKNILETIGINTN